MLSTYNCKAGSNLKTLATRMLGSAPTFARARAGVFVPVRQYSIREQGRKINKVLDRIGDDRTSEAQTTLKVVRMVGGLSVIVVICSLLWASSMSVPIKEQHVEHNDLSKDVRAK